MGGEKIGLTKEPLSLTLAVSGFFFFLPPAKAQLMRMTIAAADG